MIRYLIILLYPFVVYGCLQSDQEILPSHIEEIENVKVYSSSAKSRLLYQIHLEEEQSFGASDDILLGSIRGFDVDDSGRVIISDGLQQTMYLFNRDGNINSIIGREGSGPGEFRSISEPIIISDELIAYDVTQNIIHHFSLSDLALIKSSLLNYSALGDDNDFGMYFLNSIFPKSNGTYVAAFRPIPNPVPGYIDPERYIKFYEVDHDGNISSDFLFQLLDVQYLETTVGGQYRSGTGFPFIGKSIYAFSDEGVLFSAWSDDFFIREYHPDGDYKRAFFYDYEKIPLNVEYAIENEVREYRRSIVQNVELPEEWPALDNLILDSQNRLWVSTIVEDFEVYEWWILKESGELITTFEWPRDKPIEVVKNGFVYTRETEEETGLQQIVRYRIEMEEN